MKLARHPWNIFNRPSDQNLSDDCITMHLMPALWRSSASDSLHGVFWKRLYLFLWVIFYVQKEWNQRTTLTIQSLHFLFFIFLLSTSPSYIKVSTKVVWDCGSCCLHCWTTSTADDNVSTSKIPDLWPLTFDLMFNLFLEICVAINFLQSMF